MCEICPAMVLNNQFCVRERRRYLIQLLLVWEHRLLDDMDLPSLFWVVGV